MARITLTLPDETVARLQRYADCERRSMHAQAEWLLMALLRDWDEAEGPPRGTLGAGRGVEFPPRMTGSLDNDVPAMLAAVTAKLSPPCAQD